MKRDLTILECKVCGHRWVRRTVKPLRCPNQTCQSVYWEKGKPKKAPRKKGKP